MREGSTESYFSTPPSGSRARSKRSKDTPQHENVHEKIAGPNLRGKVGGTRFRGTLGNDFTRRGNQGQFLGAMGKSFQSFLVTQVTLVTPLSSEDYTSITKQFVDS